MASHDYFMRQIEGFTDILSMILFDRKSSDNEGVIYDTQISTEGHTLLIDLRFLVNQGLINEAENLLFEHMETKKGICYSEVSRHFYSWLDELSNEELEKYSFSRDEIAEGRKAVQQFYNNAGSMQ